MGTKYGIFQILLVLVINQINIYTIIKYNVYDKREFMAQRPKIVSTTNAARYPLEPGRFYSGVVTKVTASGVVEVKIPNLKLTVGPTMPIGTTPTNKLSLNDSVICTFTDEHAREVVVFGSARIKDDVFGTKAEITSLQSQITALAARVTALENS